MRVKIAELNGAEFRVFFRRRLLALEKKDAIGYVWRVPADGEKNVHAGIATQCVIESKPSGKICAQATVVCDSRDNFSKSAGRRRAFTAAMKQFSWSGVVLTDADDKDIDPERVRKIRAEFWNAYFSQMDKKLVAKVHANGE